MVVWISGYSSYEIVGVITLLSDSGVVVRYLQKGDRVCSGDALILCLSSEPLLGWYRYLKIVRWIAERYDAQIIVLCPEVVYQSGVIRGRNIVVVNGKSGLAQLTRVLTQSVQHCFPKGNKEDYQKDMWSVFLKRISETLLISPSSDSDITRMRKAYSQRSSMLQHLGFNSLLKLKVFIAGKS